MSWALRASHRTSEVPRANWRTHIPPCHPQLLWVWSAAVNGPVRSFLPLVALPFRSRRSMQSEILALRQQLATYKQSGQRARIRPADRLFWDMSSCSAKSIFDGSSAATWATTTTGGRTCR